MRQRQEILQKIECAPQDAQAGSALLEVFFALILILVVVLGSLTLLGATRANLVQSMIQIRMGLVADSILNDMASFYYAGGVLSVGTYDWMRDASVFNFSGLISDNRLRAADSVIIVSVPSSSPSPLGGMSDFHIALTLTAPDGRQLRRERLLSRRIR